MFSGPNTRESVSRASGLVNYSLLERTAGIVMGTQSVPRAGNELYFSSDTGVVFSHNMYDPDQGSKTQLTVDTPQNLQSTATPSFQGINISQSGVYSRISRATTGSSYTLKLPSSLPSISNQALVCDIYGQASWTTLGSIDTMVLSNTALNVTFANQSSASVDMHRLTESLRSPDDAFRYAVRDGSASMTTVSLPCTVGSEKQYLGWTSGILDWITPEPVTSYLRFDGSTNAVNGLVPPTSGNDAKKVLVGDGTWTDHFQTTQLSADKVVISSNPSEANHAATKQYVDSIAKGLVWINEVAVVATSPIGLSNQKTIDGVLVGLSNERVLVTAQADAKENGVYVSSGTAWTRSADFGSGSTANSLAAYVSGGTVYGSTTWVCSSPSGADTVNVHDITFVRMGTVPNPSAGTGLAKDASSVFSFRNDNDSLKVGADSNVYVEKVLSSDKAASFTIAAGGSAQYVVPADIGSANQVLSVGASSNLEWADVPQTPISQLTLSSTTGLVFSTAVYNPADAAVTSLTLDTPQDLQTTASPAFGSIQLTDGSTTLTLAYAAAGTTYQLKFPASAPTADGQYLVATSTGNLQWLPVPVTDVATTLKSSNSNVTFSVADNAAVTNIVFPGSLGTAKQVLRMDAGASSMTWGAPCLEAGQNLSDIVDRQAALNTLTGAGAATVGAALTANASGDAVFSVQTAPSIQTATFDAASSTLTITESNAPLGSIDVNALKQVVESPDATASFTVANVAAPNTGLTYQLQGYIDELYGDAGWTHRQNKTLGPVDAANPQQLAFALRSMSKLAFKIQPSVHAQGGTSFNAAFPCGTLYQATPGSNSIDIDNSHLHVQTNAYDGVLVVDSNAASPYDASKLHDEYIADSRYAVNTTATTAETFRISRAGAFMVNVTVHLGSFSGATTTANGLDQVFAIQAVRVSKNGTDLTSAANPVTHAEKCFVGTNVVSFSCRIDVGTLNSAPDAFAIVLAHVDGSAVTADLRHFSVQVFEL